MGKKMTSLEMVFEDGSQDTLVGEEAEKWKQWADGIIRLYYIRRGGDLPDDFAWVRTAPGETSQNHHAIRRQALLDAAGEMCDGCPRYGPPSGREHVTGQSETRGAWARPCLAIPIWDLLAREGLLEEG